MEPSAHFVMQVEVNEADIDSLGHVNNVAYVKWVQDVAVAHSDSVGLNREAYQRLGAVVVIRRHEIDYLRSAMLGDAIELRTWIADVMAAKCIRATEIRRVADGTLLAKGLTTWGFVDVAAQRPTRITDELRAMFGIAARERKRISAEPDVAIDELAVDRDK